MIYLNLVLVVLVAIFLLLYNKEIKKKIQMSNNY